MNDTQLETAKAAMASTQKGWARYLIALGTLNILLAIDFLTGCQFLSDSASIKVVDFEVPRIGFSFTFAALFGALFSWATMSSHLLKRLVCDELTNEQAQKLGRLPEVQLWHPSPISRSKISRLFFYIFAADGFVILLAVSIVHLFELMMPANLMSPVLYKGIGVFCIVVFVGALSALVIWIVPNFRRVKRVTEHNDRCANKRMESNG